MNIAAQTRRSALRRWIGWMIAVLLVMAGGTLMAQEGGATTNAFNFNIGMNLPEEPAKVDVAIRIVFLITLLTVAPSLVMLMTCSLSVISITNVEKSSIDVSTCDLQNVESPL